MSGINDARAFAQAADNLPETLRPGVQRWREEFAVRHGEAAMGALPAAAADLARFVACSEFAATVLLRQWGPAGDADPAPLVLPPLLQLKREFEGIGSGAERRSAFMRDLRRLRNRCHTQILWEDVILRRPVVRTIAALSTVAELSLDAAVRMASSELEPRFGAPRSDGERMPLLVLAMGKLGGRELNFSSDIDLLFLYPAEGETSGGRRISAHEYFAKLTRSAVALLEEVTEDGFVYRVDTRLRPFGASGPPVTGLSALESYLIEHGRGWERYAYVKARPVTGSATSRAATRLMDEIVRPFVYRRYLDYGVFESLREMQALITAQVRKKELARNVKLGPGGIREIEFIVQSLQLVRGGNATELQTPELRRALFSAVDDRDLTEAVAKKLITSYDLLRRVENALQAVRDQQTHELPSSDRDCARLALALDFESPGDLETALAATRDWVSEQFLAIGMRESARPEPGGIRPALETLWSSRADADEWASHLESLEMRDSFEIATIMERFARSSTARRVDAVAARRLRRFAANLLLALPRCRHAVTALRRILDVVESVVRRSAYLSLLNENPVVLERVLDLCGSSIALARELARYPVLLDELIDARIFEQPPAAGEITAELAERLRDCAGGDIEHRLELLAEFKRVTLFRLAVADFSGSIPIMKVSDRLTELAEAILTECLRLARADLVAQFGEPGFVVDGRSCRADLGVIAYGKLAGLEMSYSSDLDIVFIHDSHGEKQRTRGKRSVDNQVFFSRLVRRLAHFLAVQTGAGALYEIDTRLRPSGRAGLLVTSIDAFERYQVENAWTWEHQALLRSRPIAGSAVVAREFTRIREYTLRQRVRRDSLGEEVPTMRRKMRAGLDRSDDRRFDLKHGRGGIGDIEFLVQYLVLLNADRHPAVFEFPDIIRQLDALSACGCHNASEARRLQDVYRDYRALVHRLALDEQPPFADADAFLDERDFVVRQWRQVFGTAPA